MSRLLNNMASNRIESRYTHPKVRDELERLSYLIRRDSGSTLKRIEANKARTYTGDFYGLLQVFNIPTKYRWITMRLNELKSSGDFDGRTRVIFIPNIKLIDLIVNSVKL